MPSQQQQQQQQGQTVVAGSTRWCPTPEQLMILEEMYRGGLRTPSSTQIQQITAHLASYGRIEGKNVFYWFQNHKARDRQKLRRRLCMSHHLLSCAHYYAAAAHHPVGFPAAPYGGGVFDHAAAAGQLLSPTTSPTPAAAAAAAAAAAYGYYYPATSAFSVSPASRCAGTTTPPSPTHLFHYQAAGGGGGLAPAEAVGRPEYSLGKLENFDVMMSSAAGVDMGHPGLEAAAAFVCRPLKTLDLFPGGLKEEQHDVA